MPYAPTDWVDGTTPLDEAHLDKIEQQLVLADGRVLFVSNGEVINLDLAAPPSLLTYYQIYPNGGGSIRSVGAPSSHGNRILLHNVSPTAVQIQHAGGGPGGQLVNLSGATFMLPAGSIAEYVWDGSWWRQATLQPSAAGGGGGGGLDWEGAWAGATPYVKGDVVTHQGVTYGAVNDSTGQTPPAANQIPQTFTPIPLVTSLPATPFDGQEVILVDVINAATYSWRFRYVAARATNKWIFLGGSARIARVDTPETAFSATYVDLTTVGPQVIVPVAGLYEVEFGFAGAAQGTVGAEGRMTVKPGAAAASDTDSIMVKPNFTWVAPNGRSFYRQGRAQLQVAAGEALKAQYRSNGSDTFYFETRSLRVLPVAVGG